MVEETFTCLPRTSPHPSENRIFVVYASINWRYIEDIRYWVTLGGRVINGGVEDYGGQVLHDGIDPRSKNERLRVPGSPI